MLICQYNELFFPVKSAFYLLQTFSIKKITMKKIKGILHPLLEF